LKTLKTIPKSLAILILLTTFLLFNCVKFKENPLDPTTPTGFLLSLNLGYTPDKILLFPTTQGGSNNDGKYDGDIKGNYYSTAREAIDTICRNEFDNVIRVNYAGNYDYMQHVRGFISIDGADSISNYPTLYNVPTNVPIMGPDNDPNNPNRLVAYDWADLLSDDGNGNYIKNKLQDAIGLNGSWWSGSNESGIFQSGKTCNGWTNGSNTYIGLYGDFYSLNQNWIVSYTLPCNNTINLLCIAW